MIHRAKKSLGQNFLKSRTVLLKMCQTAGACDKDTILEIGPGKGSLTEKLLERAQSVIAVEKDRELIEFLKEKFLKEIKNGKLILVESDILEFNISKNLKSIPYKLVANIPYNITGAILKKFLSSEHQPEKMVLLVQKEVAERIISRHNKESILSLSVGAYGHPSYIMKVNKKLFSPSPKVDSAIILIDNISRKNFKNKEEERLFFDVIRTGFAHKRKVLRKNLKDLGISHQEIHDIFEKLEINLRIRAEDVPLNIWFKIVHFLSIKN